MSFLESLKNDFITCFIVKDRWRFITRGLYNTVKIALVAVAIGIIIGFFVAAVRTIHDQKAASTTKKRSKGKSFGNVFLDILDFICKLYVTVIRGTPVMIQIMIMFFVIFAKARDGLPVAMLTFGINSGAYVSEIIRGGIMAVDPGQGEACKALGLNYLQSMRYVIFPQALKSVLPALANEFIALLKETSVACYVAVTDLTKGGEIIRGATYVQGMPLFVVAALYLIMVVILSRLVAVLERRLRESDLRN